ncbi:MAG TPA: hypothetical protein VLA40_08475, partial [Rheinheimera sp.]|nr:hypothetical protein [Rheinheimera sp.]
MQSVNGDTGIVVITANSIGAYLNTNPNSFVNVAQASASAPVQSVTGTLVTGTSADPVVNIPTLDQVGAYSNTNPSAFINVAQAPVQSVNGDTGIVVLNADDVGAYSNTNPNSFINIAQVPIKTVTGDGVDNSNVGNVVISYPTINDIGAYSNTNPNGFVNSAGAASASPVQSVNGQTNVVVLGANDVGAYSNTNPSAFINIAQASSAAPIQTVTGDGVDNSNVGNVVISFPTLDDIGAYSNTNPANYINVAQASAAAPVQSVNGQTNVVVLDADDVGAYSNTNPSAFINVAGAPVQSVNGDTGIVVITANSIGAYLNTNPNNFINSAQAPVQSVNGDTGIVVLALGDINDVNISGVTNGQSLVYNATATEWRAVTISGGGGAVDSVNGQTGVVVLDADDVGAYSNTNPSSFINVAQAPVQSVNGSTGIVVITANSIGAYLNTNPNAFVNTAQATAAAPIKTVTGQGVNNSNVGNVVISFPTINDIGAYSNTNPSNFINSAGAPVQSVNGQTGTVSLLLTNLSDVNTAGVTNGQVIVYNSTSLAWQAGTVSGGDGAVDSVNGQTGVVVLDASDVGAIPTSEKAAANGVATLGATSILVQNTNYAFRYTPEGFYCRDASGTSNDRQFGTSTSYVLLNPVMIWSDIAVDRLAMNVVTNGGALSTYRICFYKVNEGSDVMDIVAGSEVLFDTTTNGVKIATVDIVLTKGLYMIGCLNQTGATDVIYTAANGKASFAYRHADRIFSLATNDAIRLGGT